MMSGRVVHPLAPGLKLLMRGETLWSKADVRLKVGKNVFAKTQSATCSKLPTGRTCGRKAVALRAEKED